MLQRLRDALSRYLAYWEHPYFLLHLGLVLFLALITAYHYYMHNTFVYLFELTGTIIATIWAVQAEFLNRITKSVLDKLRPEVKELAKDILKDDNLRKTFAKAASEAVEECFRFHGSPCAVFSSGPPTVPTANHSATIDAFVQKHGIIRVQRLHDDLAACFSGNVRIRSDSDMKAALRTIKVWLKNLTIDVAVLPTSYNTGPEDGKRWFIHRDLLDFLEKDFFHGIKEQVNVIFHDPLLPTNVDEYDFYRFYVWTLSRLNEGKNHKTLSRNLNLTPEIKTMPSKDDSFLGEVWMRISGDEPHNPTDVVQSAAESRKRFFYVRWTGPLSGYSLEEISAEVEDTNNGGEAFLDKPLSYLYLDPNPAQAGFSGMNRFFKTINEERLKSESFDLRDIDDQRLSTIFQNKPEGDKLTMVVDIKTKWKDNKISLIAAVDTTMVENHMYLWQNTYFYQRVADESASAWSQTRNVRRLFLHNYGNQKVISTDTFDRIAGIIENNLENKISVGILSSDKALSVANEACAKAGLATFDESLDLDFNLAQGEGLISGWYIERQEINGEKESKVLSIKNADTNRYALVFSAMWATVASDENNKVLNDKWKAFKDAPTSDSKKYFIAALSKCLDVKVK